VAEATRLLSDIGHERKRRMVWSQGGHAAIEVRGLPGRGAAHLAMSKKLRAALHELRGVRWAEVNAVTAQVLIAFDDGKVSVDQLVDAVQTVEEAHGTADDGFAWEREIHPADSAPLAAAYASVAADLAGVAAGLAGWLLRVQPLKPAARIPVAVLEGYPRLREILERRIGPISADLALSLGNAVAYGLSDGPAKPAIDACHQMLVAAEVRARRDLWSKRGPELSLRSGDLARKRPRQADRPRPFPPGPIESHADRAAFGSLVTAAGVFGLTREPSRAADVILAGLPRSAALGRGGFSATLGRELARQGIMPMDPDAYRRLDRVSAILVDSAVLCTSQPLVLSASAVRRDGDDAAVWQAANVVLRDLSVDDLCGSGPWRGGDYLLTRAQGGKQDKQSPRSTQGLRLRLSTLAGDRLGKVVVGCELDPLAEAVLGAARATRARLLLTRHASTHGLVARADEVVDDDQASRIHALTADGEGVLLVGGTDGEALSAADVSISCVKDGEDVGWPADLLCEGGLAGVWRVLTAAGRARGVSERAVTVSLSGSALAILLAAVGNRAGMARGGRPRSPAEVASPAQIASLVNLIQGAHAASSAARAALPEPWPRTPWHALDAGDVLSRLDAIADRSRDASTYATAAASGPALLMPLAAPVRFGGELAAVVFDELRDPLTPVLVMGAAAAAVLGSGTDAVLVGSVMVGNALMSGMQRLRTEHELRHLLLAELPPARRVRRKPGEPIPDAVDPSDTDILAASELRVGDVIALRPDDVVPADVRLLTAEELEVDESALTGESMPVNKDPAPVVASQVGDRRSMLYEGTTVLAGEAVGVVVATGLVTEAGQASAAATTGPRPAGVQARLAELTRIALPVTGIGGLVVTGLGLARGVQLRQALTAGVAVAIAAVPEGLPLVSTVAQLAAARRLSRRGVLVRSPRTLEALGRVDVLCFDKTGTLTEGRLHVVGAALCDRTVDLAAAPGQHLLRIAARTCPRSGERQVHATDEAILAAADDISAGEDAAWEPVGEIPFQASRGYSASLGRTGDGTELAVKGAPEVLLERCSRAYALADDGSVRPRPLTKQRRRAAKSIVDELAADGLRVLAVAERSTVRPGADKVPSLTELVTDLTLVGFVGIADVMRPDATQIVEALAAAGIRTVMITGDHPATAAAIARAAGMPDVGHVLLGDELDTMAETERRRKVDGCAVFARVSPQQKVRIVADLQKAGHVVAMTGDGTNDAAAIRLADVGIGVSARGSTAARNASDLILTASNLADVAGALAEGRALWRNVADALSMLLGGNVGEIAFMITGTALGGRSPLNTRQLLLVNMLTDMFPALAVALGPPDGDEDLSTGPAGQVLGEPLARTIAVRGGATALGATLAWVGGRVTGRRRRAATMGLAAVVSTQLAQTLLSNVRSPVVIFTTAASGGILVFVVNTPGVSQFFGCTPLGPVAWMIVAASTATATAVSVVTGRTAFSDSVNRLLA
jgi:cation-transporting ATPase I